MSIAKDLFVHAFRMDALKKLWTKHVVVKSVNAAAKKRVANSRHEGSEALHKGGLYEVSELADFSPRKRVRYTPCSGTS